MMTQISKKNLPGMAMADYNTWINALINNDVNVVIKILTCLDDVHQQELLHGTFPCDTSEGILKQRHKMVMRHPQPANSWHMAVAYGAQRTIKLLLTQYNIDIHVVDEHGDNAIHALIHAACVLPELEPSSVATYHLLCEILKPEDISRLLKTQNNNHLHPLEMAIHSGTLKLYSEIFNTKGKSLVWMVLLINIVNFYLYSKWLVSGKSCLWNC